MTTVILAAAFFISAGVMVYLSLKGKEVTVPNLIGKSEAEAERLLGAEGLRLKVGYRATEDNSQAKVISEQRPDSGTVVKAGQAVIVSIGTDPKREEAKAEALPTATPTPKPKPKPKPSPSPQVAGETGTKKPEDEKSKEAPDKTGVGKSEVSKEPSRGEVKATPKPSPKISPKPSPKPSPKKTDGN